jgi:hypothetical protein
VERKNIRVRSRDLLDKVCLCSEMFPFSLEMLKILFTNDLEKNEHNTHVKEVREILSVVYNYSLLPPCTKS